MVRGSSRPELELVQPDSPTEWQAATHLVRHYASSLPISLDFQDFEHELADLAAEYRPPDGMFLLARLEGAFVACGAFPRLSADACEMKRLYVEPGARNQGIGHLLASALITSARERGYHRMLLDTLSSMHGALSLYRSLGFERTDAYRFNPIQDAVYMQLRL